METNKLLSVNEVSKKLGVSIHTIYRLIRQDANFPVMRILGQFRFRETAVDKWMKDKEREAEAVYKI